MDSRGSTIRRLALGAGFAVLAAAALPASAQQAAERAIPGFLNPQTGQFTTFGAWRDAQPEAVVAAPVTATGTIKVTFNVNIKGGGPTTAGVNCLVYVNGLDLLGGSNYSETKAMKATRTDSTATCTVSIPFSWVVSSRDQAKYTLGYTISLTGLTDTSSVQMRSASSNLSTPAALPAEGTTVSKTFNVTL